MSNTKSVADLLIEELKAQSIKAYHREVADNYARHDKLSEERRARAKMLVDVPARN